MKYFRNLFSKVGRETKGFIGLLFLVGIPLIVFLSPFGFSFYYGDPWYMLLFFVTWIPAIVIAILVNIFLD